MPNVAATVEQPVIPTVLLLERQQKLSDQLLGMFKYLGQYGFSFFTLHLHHSVIKEDLKLPSKAEEILKTTLNMPAWKEQHCN